jgi:hypothetical protein
MAQGQVRNRPEQLVAQMASEGVSTNFQVFAQNVFNCIDLAASTARVALIVSPDADKNVTIVYRVASTMNIVKILQLVCGNKNSIDLASIRIPAPDPSGKTTPQPGEVQLSIRISSNPPKPRERRFPNKVSDLLRHIGLSKLDTDTGLDIQKYIINIDEKQPVPLWLVDQKPETVTLHADNVVELDLFHIKPLFERWTNITDITYSTYLSEDPKVHTPRISFALRRTYDKDVEVEEITAGGKRKREDNATMFDWLFGKK